MKDYIQADLPAQDPYALTTEPNFNREDFGKPYDFQLMGGELTRNAILHALLPKKLTASRHNSLFIVLQLMQVRLFNGAKRTKEALKKKLGNYTYTWDTVPVMAQQAGMEDRAFRDNVSELVRLDIIYRVTGTNGEPNHYRFTDAAFKMAHALQLVFRHIQFEAERVKEKGLTSSKAKGRDRWVLERAKPEHVPDHVRMFHVLLEVSDAIHEGWHESRDPKGKLRHPETLDNWPIWRAVPDRYLETTLADSEN